jgi:hypothetical protein
MRRAQFVAGILLIAGFLASGLYMDRRLNHLRGMAAGPRMLYRASHINLLLIGAANVLSGRRPKARGVESIAAAMTIVAAAFFGIAFLTEPSYSNLWRPWTRVAVYSIAIAAGLEVCSALIRPRSSRR